MTHTYAYELEKWYTFVDAEGMSKTSQPTCFLMGVYLKAVQNDISRGRPRELSVKRALKYVQSDKFKQSDKFQQKNASRTDYSGEQTGPYLVSRNNRTMGTEKIVSRTEKIRIPVTNDFIARSMELEDPHFRVILPAPKVRSKASPLDKKGLTVDAKVSSIDRKIVKTPRQMMYKLPTKQLQPPTKQMWQWWPEAASFAEEAPASKPAAAAQGAAASEPSASLAAAAQPSAAIATSGTCGAGAGTCGAGGRAGLKAAADCVQGGYTKAEGAFRWLLLVCMPAFGHCAAAVPSPTAVASAFSSAVASASSAFSSGVASAASSAFSPAVASKASSLVSCSPLLMPVLVLILLAIACGASWPTAASGKGARGAASAASSDRTERPRPSRAHSRPTSMRAAPLRASTAVCVAAAAACLPGAAAASVESSASTTFSWFTEGGAMPLFFILAVGVFAATADLVLRQLRWRRDSTADLLPPVFSPPPSPPEPADGPSTAPEVIHGQWILAHAAFFTSWLFIVYSFGGRLSELVTFASNVTSVDAAGLQHKKADFDAWTIFAAGDIILSLLAILSFLSLVVLIGCRLVVRGVRTCTDGILQIERMHPTILDDASSQNNDGELWFEKSDVFGRSRVQSSLDKRLYETRWFITIFNVILALVPSASSHVEMQAGAWLTLILTSVGFVFVVLVGFTPAFVWSRSGATSSSQVSLPVISIDIPADLPDPMCGYKGKASSCGSYELHNGTCRWDPLGAWEASDKATYLQEQSILALRKQQREAVVAFRNGLLSQRAELRKLGTYIPAGATLVRIIGTMKIILAIILSVSSFRFASDFVDNRKFKVACHMLAFPRELKAAVVGSMYVCLFWVLAMVFAMAGYSRYLDNKPPLWHRLLATSPAAKPDSGWSRFHYRLNWVFDVAEIISSILALSAKVLFLAIRGNFSGHFSSDAGADMLLATFVVFLLEIGFLLLLKLARMSDLLEEQEEEEFAKALSNPALRRRFFSKVGGTLESNRRLDLLDWSSKRLDSEDASIVAYIVSVEAQYAFLTTLNLRSNDIGPEGAKAIGDSLRCNGVLTSLNVRGNDIGPTGATAIAEALRVNGVLKELNLAANSIGPTGATALADALIVNGVLTSLNLSDNTLCGVKFGRGSYDASGIQALAEALKVNGVLTTLNLGDNLILAAGAAAIAEALRGNGVLTNLVLWRNNINDEGAKAIAAALRVNGVLTSLDVAANLLSEEAALSIVRVERQRNKLTSLGLTHCRIGETGAAEIAEYVSGSGVLTTLNLANNNIYAEGAAAIAEALRGNGVLTTLDVGFHIPPLTEEAALGIVRVERQRNKLTSLGLARCKIGPTGAAEIAEYVSGSGVLTHLDLEDNYISDEGAASLGKALAVNAVLTDLNLPLNNIGYKGGAALGKALEVNGVLTKLNLNGHELDLPKLRGTDPVTSLDLAKNGLGPASAIVIASLIAGNAVLTSLNLQHNRIDNEGAAAIAQALRGNGVLTKLSLYGNFIRAEGAKALASALRVNGVLTELNIGHNEIGPKGAKAIGGALAVNGVLTSLDVGFNSLTEEAALGIVRVERQRNKLTSLGLADCSIGPTGAAEIAEYVSGSGVLTALYLRRFNFLGDKGKGVIRDAVSGRVGFKLEM